MGVGWGWVSAGVRGVGWVSWGVRGVEWWVGGGLWSCTWALVISMWIASGVMASPPRSPTAHALREDAASERENDRRRSHQASGVAELRRRTT